MPADLSSFSGRFPPAVLQAVQAIFTAKPEQEQTFLNDYGGDLGQWLNAFQGWWTANGSSVASQLDQFGPEIGLLGALGFDINPQAVPPGTLNTNGSGQPLEVGLLNATLPAMLTDVNGDAARRNLVGSLATTALSGVSAAATTIGRTQGGGFDGRAYLQANPDVSAEYQRQRGAGLTTLDENQFAERHYLQFGQREGRQPAYTLSSQLAGDYNNANQTTAANIAANNTAFQTQLGALQKATTSLQDNLSGELAARAAALQTQIASLNDNISELDASQRAALATQIASMQGNLEEQVATQRQALQEQLAALGTAATTEAQARRAALNQEITALTAAQAPLAEARIRAADLQATAVNVGLERERDQMTADAARQGYVGGSSARDGAAVRATVGARQHAAEAMGAATTANATDTRDIGVRGATGERSIADALAGAQREIAGYGAGTNYQLTSNFATGRRAIGDFGAQGTAGISNTTATNRFNVGNYGANTTYANGVYGAGQNRGILDSFAQGTYGLTASNAQQNQGATIAGNQQRSNYYDGDYTRRLGGAMMLPGLTATAATTLTALDDFGTSGLTRTQRLLDWWTPRTSTPPTPGITPTTANNSGNDLASIGAGLTGAALNIGAANNWWRRPSTSPSTTLPPPVPGDYTN